MAEETQAHLYAIRMRVAAACEKMKGADKCTIYLLEVKVKRALCCSIVQPSLRDMYMARVRK